MFGNLSVIFTCSFRFALVQQEVERIRITDGMVSKGSDIALSMGGSHVKSIETDLRPAKGQT